MVDLNGNEPVQTKPTGFLNLIYFSNLHYYQYFY